MCRQYYFYPQHKTARSFARFNALNLRAEKGEASRRRRIRVSKLWSRILQKESKIRSIRPRKTRPFLKKVMFRFDGVPRQQSIQSGRTSHVYPALLAMRDMLASWEFASTSGQILSTSRRNAPIMDLPWDRGLPRQRSGAMPGIKTGQDRLLRHTDILSKSWLSISRSWNQQTRAGNYLSQPPSFSAGNRKSSFTEKPACELQAKADAEQDFQSMLRITPVGYTIAAEKLSTMAHRGNWNALVQEKQPRTAVIQQWAARRESGGTQQLAVQPAR